MIFQNRNFYIFGNGHQYNIIGALEDFLEKNDCAFRSVRFPLFKHENKVLTIEKVRKKERRKTKSFYLYPPLSYVFDPLITLFGRPLKNSILVSFNPMVSLILILKNVRKTNLIIHWHIDFTPIRFQYKALNYIYRAVDKFITIKSDLNVEISQFALVARQKLYQVELENKSLCVGVGIWEKEILQNKYNSHYEQNIIFIGNLRPGQGVEKIIEVAPKLRNQFHNLRIHVIGGGEFFDFYQDMAIRMQVNEIIRFYGELNQFEMEKLLEKSQLAFALYDCDNKSFSYYADPSKIKQYASKGIPTVVTNFSPYAEKLIQSKILMEAENLEKLVEATTLLFKNEEVWNAYSNSIIKFARMNTWENNFNRLKLSIQALF
jgi:glycosyltransferase involved in cell wall biosynthesis